jgi:thiamine transport system permease protein
VDESRRQLNVSGENSPQRRSDSRRAERVVTARPSALAPRVVTAVAALPVLVLLVGFVWPVANIIGRGLSLDAVGDVLGNGDTVGVIWFTTWQAAVSTLLTVALGLAPALVIARYRFVGRSLLRSLVTVPFVLPTVVVGTAFLAVLPTSLHRTIPGIVIAHVWMNLAIVVRTVGARVSQLDPKLVDAATMLGASRMRAWWSVTLPLLRGSLLAAASIVFLFCFTSFGIIRLVGGPAHPTLEVEIWRRTTQLLDLRTAAVLSIVQLVVVGALIGMLTRWQRHHGDSGRLSRGSTDQAPVGSERWFVGFTATVLAAVVVVPLMVLVAQTFRVTASTWGLAAWRGVLGNESIAPVDHPLGSLWLSCRTAAIAAWLAVLVGGLAAVAITSARRFGALLDTGVMLPLGTSAVTIGFGLLITFDVAPVDFRGSWFMIPFGHALVAVPIVVRIVLPALRAIPHGLREAATMLGASPAQVWSSVDRPILTRAMAVGAGFAAAVSLGEFGATSFLTRTGADTAPVAISRYLGRPTPLNLAAASALATLLMLLTLVVILLIDRRRTHSDGWV